MTTPVDICNRALLALGSQRVISSLTQDSVEAKACNTIYENTRDDLLRMAPWGCAFATANLTYITSVPGTPENTSPATTLWQPGQPAPPWAYEYQYPIDCLRACWITPQSATGFADSVPITTAVTGGASSYWSGEPPRFKIATDKFYPLESFVVATPGVGYKVAEVLTLDTTVASGLPPLGAGAQIIVLTVDGAGGILTGIIISQVPDSTIKFGGSYFRWPTNPLTVASVIGRGGNASVGTGAAFTGTLDPTQVDQRVILTNQEFAILNYVKQVTDPNTFDTLLQSALQDVLSAQLAMVLIGDKDLANRSIAAANSSIIEARKADGNEGLTINDVTPDWLRIRGVNWTDGYTSGPYSSFDWGGTWQPY